MYLLDMNLQENIQRIKQIINEQGVKPAGAERRFWDGLSRHLESSYGYTVENDNKLTYDFDNTNPNPSFHKLVTMVISWIPMDESDPMGNGRMSMEIRFSNPSIVSKNAPHIANIQKLLNAKLTNNTIIANKPQGYLTQNIDKVANILFNVIKINGKTMANTPANGGQIVDYGDYNQFQKK